MKFSEAAQAARSQWADQTDQISAWSLPAVEQFPDGDCRPAVVPTLRWDEWVENCAEEGAVVVAVSKHADGNGAWEMDTRAFA